MLSHDSIMLSNGRISQSLSQFDTDKIMAILNGNKSKKRKREDSVPTHFDMDRSQRDSVMRPPLLQGDRDARRSHLTSISERESTHTAASLAKLKKSRHQKNHSETSFVNMLGGSAQISQ